MTKLQLDGIEVHASWLTQRSYRAAYCDHLLPVTDTNKTEALREFARAGATGKYRGLRVSGVADLGFLTEFPKLLYLELVDRPKLDLKPLEALNNLRGLRLQTPGTGIDFFCFPGLEVFVGDWHEDNVGLERCRELRQVRIWGFRPRSKDLTALAGIVRLEWLTVTQTNLASLAGIEALKDLRYCEIAHAPKLESVAALSGGDLQLRELELSNAKSVRSYQSIAACHWLRSLRISACAPIPELTWLAPLQRLELLSFVDTDVESCDLSPLLRLPELRYVGSMDRKHYQPRVEELNAALALRHA